VLLRLLPIFFIAVLFSGCATTQTKNDNGQLETRVTELEKNLQAKDSEIVDLQYQVKDLSSKIDAGKSADADQDAAPSDSAVKPEEVKAGGPVNAQIVRVRGVSPEKIQQALKAAGVYTGPIDGKIGPGTRDAIIEFQKSHGLKADGVLGHKTWEYLKKFLQ
jgi:peptidoglycan hydrolase-like protein with peptidoglycan-binding domain